MGGQRNEAREAQVKVLVAIARRYEIVPGRQIQNASKARITQLIEEILAANLSPEDRELVQSSQQEYEATFLRHNRGRVVKKNQDI